MENRVYYGQYSLQHWINLIMKKNILLPEYQRLFVWDEVKVKTLIETFKKKQFVPPIVIGAFKETGSANQNYILDGQQRLTSILLAYLGLFPDKAVFRATMQERTQLANDNDTEVETEVLDNILEWQFTSLTDRGRNSHDILSGIPPGNYKMINLGIDENFLKNTFLGFSYLVPQTTNAKEQQKYYSSVFRNINVQGERLLAQESRASLYFLDKNLAGFFDPDFNKHISVKILSTLTKSDFVRFLALLSQYAKDGNADNIARGFKHKMESYYEDYIYSVVEHNPSSKFKEFLNTFSNGDFQPRFDRLEKAINDLEIPKEFPSIIDMDIYLFGLIYIIVFEDKEIDISKKEDLLSGLRFQITAAKANEGHRKDPGALTYLRERINTSIELYKRYIDEQA